MITTAGETDVLGIHVRPTKPFLKEFGWKVVREIAESLIPKLTQFPDVEEIKKDEKEAVVQGFSGGDYEMLALPYSNICGRTVILMFVWEQSRRIVQDGSHKQINRN